MKTIYKYELPRPGNQYGIVQVLMPPNARPISAGLQGTATSDVIVAWAVVETDAAQEPRVREFEVCGTGKEMLGDHAEHLWRFLGTVKQGPFFWHVFERTPQ